MIKQVRRDEWTTLEWFLGTSAEVVFKEPAGAMIRIRYGIGWFSYTKQHQTFDGVRHRRLIVSGLSLFLARVQVYSPVDTGIVYKLFFDTSGKFKLRDNRKPENQPASSVDRVKINHKSY
jgi:hypothetical protein